MRFLPISTPKSPRMVPGAEAKGLVTPIKPLPVLITSFPSHTIATCGIEASYQEYIAPNTAGSRIPPPICAGRVKGMYAFGWLIELKEWKIADHWSRNEEVHKAGKERLAIMLCIMLLSQVF